MADTKRKYHTTPKGEAKYCALTKPDVKFNPDGDYYLILALEEGEAADVITAIDEAISDNLENIKKEPKNAKRKIIKQNNPPYRAEEDEDGGETGRYLFNIKMRAKIKLKDGTVREIRPAIYDSRGNPISPENVGFGSTVKAAFEISPYDNPSTGAGVTLRLKGVQIFDLKTGALTAKALGFEAEEGGYVGTEAPAAETDNAEPNEADF